MLGLCIFRQVLEIMGMTWLRVSPRCAELLPSPWGLAEAVQKLHTSG